MKHCAILMVLCLVFSCHEKTIISELTGDLYFSVFRIGSYYNQPESTIEWWETYFTTTRFEQSAKNEQRLFAFYTNLKKHDLLYKPFVELFVRNDSSIVRLYLEIEDYEKVKIYKRQKLQDLNKRVVINSEVSLIDDGIYRCDKLKSVQLVDGQTFQVQKKFKIEDYN